MEKTVARGRRRRKPRSPDQKRSAPRSKEPPTGWWQRLQRGLRLPRRLKFTREGRYFFFISLGIGFAAVNTGNNLLYLLLGMTLSIIVASGVLSEVALRKLSVRRQFPPEIYAERPFLVGIELSNQKRRIPSFSIEIEDLAGGLSLEKKCYFLKIPPQRSQHTSYRYTLARRGVHRFDAVRISTKFPFALFRKSREVDLPDEVLVYPARVDVSDLTAAWRSGQGAAPLRRGGRGEDFFSVREFRPGDDSREIHWKSSARVGRLMLREREDAINRRVAIYLDNRLPAPATEEIRLEVERAIARAASLASHYLQRGFRVRLVTRTARVNEGTGAAHLRHILRTLALLEVLPSVGRPEPLPFSGSDGAILVGPGPAPVAGRKDVAP
jgi:uncharacterized protein (DUF58 family)